MNREEQKIALLRVARANPLVMRYINASIRRSDRVIRAHELQARADKDFALMQKLWAKLTIEERATIERRPE